MFKRNCVVKYVDNFGVEHAAKVEAAIRGLYRLDSSFWTEDDVFDRMDVTSGSSKCDPSGWSGTILSVTYGAPFNSDRTMVTLACAVVAYLRSLFLPRHKLALEAVALRQQLAVFKRKQPRPRLDRLDRLFWIVLRRLWEGSKLG